MKTSRTLTLATLKHHDGPAEQLHQRHGRQAAHLQGVDRVSAPVAPKALDGIADVVLAYRPPPKSKPAKKRKQRARKIARKAVQT